MHMMFQMMSKWQLCLKTSNRVTGLSPVRSLPSSPSPAPSLAATAACVCCGRSLAPGASEDDFQWRWGLGATSSAGADLQGRSTENNLRLTGSGKARRRGWGGVGALGVSLSVPHISTRGLLSTQQGQGGASPPGDNAESQTSGNPPWLLHFRVLSCTQGQRAPHEHRPYRRRAGRQPCPGRGGQTLSDGTCSS